MARLILMRTASIDPQTITALLIPENQGAMCADDVFIDLHAQNRIQIEGQCGKDVRSSWHDDHISMFFTL